MTAQEAYVGRTHVEGNHDLNPVSNQLHSLSKCASILVKGFRVSAKKRHYVPRLRLHGRDFDFGNTPEAAVAYSRCIGEMRSILLQRKVANTVADSAIFRALQAAVEFVDKADDRSCWSARRV